MLINLFNTITDNAVNYMQMYGIWFGFFIVFLESMIPWLPLFVFIALNIASFGTIVGFLISWVATICGCLVSYAFFRYLIGKRIKKVINRKQNIKLNKVIKSIKEIDFSKLVLIVALPFTPAFLINIACGMANVNFKKFFAALLIGKTSIVYFWGFIGKSMIESITDPSAVITICLLLTIAFLASKIVVKKFNLE